MRAIGAEVRRHLHPIDHGVDTSRRIRFRAYCIDARVRPSTLSEFAYILVDIVIPKIQRLGSRLLRKRQALGHRIDALQARFDALAGETQADRRSAFDELARGVQDLGERIRQIPRD